MDSRQNKFTVKDYSVSGEEFVLLPMEDGALLKTTPQPSPSELGRYYQSEDYISHTDGSRNLFEKTYQLVKGIALKLKVNLIESSCDSKGKLLDIGCGTGDFLVAAQNSGWIGTGSEPSNGARTIAKNKGLSVFEQTSALPDSTCDVITMWHVMEHVPDPDAQMREILRLLKPQGIVVIAVPNFKSADARHYGKAWAAYDVPRHLWHFSKQAIRNLANRNEMEVVKILPMWFDAFYVSLLSEKHKTGKMRVASGIWQGLWSNLSAVKSGECSSQIYLLKRK